VLRERLTSADKDVQVYWIQEENLNGGAYLFVERRLGRVLRELGIKK
jgi:2-oxoglutarate dehydrogenase complex dehydrogenase (E1) component-like enzyme